MRYRSYDLDEVLAYAQHGLVAHEIIETLGLSVGERTIQRAVARHFGHRPTRQSLAVYDPIRDVVVKLMIEAGQDARQCSECHKWTTRKLAIRATCADPDVNDLVFVCCGCATVADR